MKEGGNFYIGINKHTLPATFSVNPVAKERADNCPIDEDIFEPIFEGDQSLASAFVGWSIATLAISNNQDIIMLFNENEEVKFPDGSVLRGT